MKLASALAQGPAWGWGSARTLGSGTGAGVMLTAWPARELRARWPLIGLRLLRNRPVLAANLTAFLVALGFYPLGPLVVRFVQTRPRPATVSVLPSRLPG